jgi:osmoprotectant transport system substrate-binding protein
LGNRRWFVPLLVALLSSACTSSSPDRGTATSLGDDAVTVASFNFGESEVLAEIYGQALERGGIPVRRAFHLGPREFVAPALAAGLVELVPEYAGTAVQFLSLGAVAPPHDATRAHDALVAKLDGSRVRALAAAPAEDANAFVVRRALAEREGWQKLSDLTAAAPRLTLGGPPECPTRPACLSGLEQTYGLRFEEFVPLDAGGPLTREALQNGDIDVAMLFTTDPAVGRDDLVELADDRNLQPAENVTPLVRQEVLDRWGAAAVPIIDDVSRRLTTDALRQLNQRLAAGTAVPVIATEWLTSGASA